MPDHSLYGKQKICYTEVTDFTDFQGIGRDPMYKRFDSVYSVINNTIPEQYRDFLAHPLYSAEDDQIQWYVKDWVKTPVRYTQLNGDELEKYKTIKDQTIKAFTDTISTLKGEDRQILIGAMKYIDDDFIFCYDDKVVIVAWGMKPDSNQHIVKGTVIHDLKIQNKRKVRFDAGEHGSFKTKLDGILNREDGAVLSHLDIPSVIPNPGFEFKCWDQDPLGLRITKDITFHAIYNELPQEEVPTTSSEKVRVDFASDHRGTLIGETTLFVEKGTAIPISSIPSVQATDGFIFNGWDKEIGGTIDDDIIFNAAYSEKEISCYFEPGEYGSLTGDTSFILPYGTLFPKTDIPIVTPKKGYDFIGWDINPVDYELKEDTVFTAQYEKATIIPWYKRFWGWLTGKGCLKWLLWLLLAFLLLLLLSQLLRGCPGAAGGITRDKDRDKVKPSDQIEAPDGRTIDNNGPITGIVGDDGQLPSDNIIAPIVGDEGSIPPVVENPGAPSVISDRLNLFFEDEYVDLNQFVAELKNVLSPDVYEIVGVDHNVPMLTVKVDPNIRDQIRETLPAKLPNYKFFVVDESIFTIVGHISEDTQDPGWHLRAINLKEGWKYSKGNENVVVAVVDDGIDGSHELFKGRFYKPYNVFTQDNRLSSGEGHGTHVAGLAIGSDINYNKGVSGVAPKCLLMPVQVFDNGMCTFSSVTSGIMYAIHNGATVVNVSIGPNFRGLDILPIADQDLIARTQFKNEEKVWRRIIKVANDRNVIIVFAVGNDNIIANIPPENRTNTTVNVAAVARDFSGTDFTNYGKGSNISAPGKGILSSVPINEYAFFDGTSMAAPIVSGTVALMKSVRQDVDVRDILYILQHTGIPISDYMPPLIQVDKALEMLINGIPDPETTDIPILKNPGSSNQDLTPITGGIDNPGSPNNQDLTRPSYPGGGADNDSPRSKDNNTPTNPGNNLTPDNPRNDVDAPEENSGTDYDAIRRMIEFYKQKISELEKLLPENK